MKSCLLLSSLALNFSDRKCPFALKSSNINICDRGDVVEIDTWVDAAGKNGMRRDWIIRDYNTQEIITRATRCVLHLPRYKL